MIDSSTAERYYRESHQAICDLITTENEHLPVPACPGWSLRDLLAHVTGVMQDFVAGNTEGAPGPEWTAVHVARFREAHIESVKSAWRAALDKSGPIFRTMGAQLLPDIVTHEFDMRGALGDAGERGSERLSAAMDVLASWGDGFYRQSGVPAIKIRTDRKHHTIGEGSPQAIVSTTVFEASRALTGRRSETQIRALDWSADPSPWVNQMSMLGKRDTDLAE